MPDHVTGDRLTSLFRPRSVALVGASDKSTFSLLAYRNLVEFARHAAGLGMVLLGPNHLGFALALGDSLESLEVNPLLVDGARIEALDAIVTWREHS